MTDVVCMRMRSEYSLTSLASIYLFFIHWQMLSFIFCRHILAAVHFNFNLHRDVKRADASGEERLKVSYPKFKNGEATVRDVKITQNFGMCLFGNNDYSHREWGNDS